MIEEQGGGYLTDHKMNIVDTSERVKEPSLFETEPQSDLDTSFTEETETVMERMLPLPWLIRNSKVQRCNSFTTDTLKTSQA